MASPSRSRSVDTIATRVTIWVALVSSTLAAAAIFLFGVVAIASTIASGEVTVQMSTTAPLPPEADAGSGTITSGTFDTATVSAGSLDGGTIALSVLGTAFGILTSAAVAAALALLCWRMLHPQVFSRSLSTVVTTSGAVVLIGGIISQAIHVFVAWMVADQLNAASAGLDGFWPISAEVDPTFMALGVGLALVGLAFSHGERIQRDTEGLV